MIWYLYISTLVFIFLSVIWNASSSLNVFLKISFILLAIAGSVLSLQNLGFIIKITT